MATVCLAMAFPVVSSAWELTLVDAIADPAQVRESMAAMTPDQRTAHAWITATLDVAYPLAYGALFAGSACAFFPRVGRYLAMLLIVVIPVDLLEGIVQLLALVDSVDLLEAKALLTPLKFGLAFLGLAITLLGWVSWLTGRLRSRS